MIFFLRSIQNSPGVHSASYPVRTGCSVLWLVAKSFSRPLTSISCRG